MADRGPEPGPPDALIDLRSDSVTLPTEAMWEAMRAARLGWAPVGEDGSVNALERYAATLAGMESALFLATGAMANLVALMSHTEPGDQVILEASSHILWSEEQSFARLCGLSSRAIEGDHGRLDPEALRAAITDTRFGHRPTTSLICLENTHNASGGSVLTPADMRAVARVASELAVAIHLDGARALNASVALGIGLAELVSGADSVAINLNKGLSAPAGALLCGSRAFVDRAQRNLRRLGGASIHQAGILAAAGLVALRSMIPRLAEDHRVARLLATALADVPGLRVHPEAVRTNIVLARLDTTSVDAGALVAELRTRGIGVLAASTETIRFVTHRHVGEDQVAPVVARVADALATLARSPHRLVRERPVAGTTPGGTR